VRPGPSRRGTRAAAIGLATSIALGGCAQIKTSSKIEIVPKPGAKAIVIGPPHGQVSARGIDTQWTQDGDSLEIELVQTRRCSAVRHEPVVRIERITRKAGGALYWEYGIAGAALALGLTALIRPDLFSQGSVSSDGETIEDLRAGYRVGGILTGIGAIALGAGIYDTVRARDEVRYAEAYRVRAGEDTACARPSVPLGEQSVELIIGEWRSEEPTDRDGKVRFVLPPVEELGLPPAPAATEPAPAGNEPVAHAEAPVAADPDASAPTGEMVAPAPPPVPVRVAKGVLRIDAAHALAIDFVVPYEAPEAREHGGRLEIDPVPTRPVDRATRPDSD
jgi:hypothetical protein